MDLKSVETEAKTVAEADLSKAKTWLGLSGPNWISFLGGCVCGLLVSWIARHL